MDANNLAILLMECGDPFDHAAVHETGCIGNGRRCCGCWPWDLSKRVEKNVVDYRNEDLGDCCEWDLLSQISLVSLLGIVGLQDTGAHLTTSRF